MLTLGTLSVLISSKRLFFLFVLTDDNVYLENDDERKEYVMNETGRIYTSKSPTHKGRAWNFGQVSQPKCFCNVQLIDLKVHSHWALSYRDSVSVSDAQIGQNPLSQRCSLRAQWKGTSTSQILQIDNEQLVEGKENLPLHNVIRAQG